MATGDSWHVRVVKGLWHLWDVLIPYSLAAIAVGEISGDVSAAYDWAPWILLAILGLLVVGFILAVTSLFRPRPEIEPGSRPPPGVLSTILIFLLIGLVISTWVVPQGNYWLPPATLLLMVVLFWDSARRLGSFPQMSYGTLSLGQRTVRGLWVGALLIGLGVSSKGLGGIPLERTDSWEEEPAARFLGEGALSGTFFLYLPLYSVDGSEEFVEATPADPEGGTDVGEVGGGYFGVHHSVALLPIPFLLGTLLYLWLAVWWPRRAWGEPEPSILKDAGPI